VDGRIRPVHERQCKDSSFTLRSVPKTVSDRHHVEFVTPEQTAVRGAVNQLTESGTRPCRTDHAAANLACRKQSWGMRA